jgi:hypothetical protein
MDELKPGDELAVTGLIQTGFHHYDMDRSTVLSTNAPSLTSASGFEDCVAKAAQNQRSSYESGCIIFDEENGLYRPSVKFRVGLR